MTTPQTASTDKHFDVVIVGAGLSGIGAAVRLQRECPTKSFAILESRDAIGGTWDLYRYPGIRSDSDMHTLGYDFKPWLADKAIADGTSILDYVRETADEHGLREHILFERRVETASWSSEEARWTLSVRHGSGEDAEPKRETIHCNFVLMCSGYYSYEQAHQPHFEGQEDFEGAFFHPQFWPEELDYRDKRVVVIGSGATAMTLVPAMAQDTEHITMLQRSPTYVVSRPERDGLANLLRKFLPARVAYAITRFKNVELQRRVYEKTRSDPERVKSLLLGRVRKALGPDYDIEKHFTPSYNPWDQRLCLVPDGDLFDAIRSGRASVVTDRIERFTKTGILLQSGEELAADIIVSATGLTMKVLGGVRFSVDGASVDFAKRWTYKGMMFSGVPNLVQTFGYINASWTLRADLTAAYSCRLLQHLSKTGQRQCTPVLRSEDEGMEARPWVDGFSAGYMQRVMHLFPKQGDRDPWRNTQNYAEDKKLIRRAPLEDGCLVFSNPG